MFIPNELKKLVEKPNIIDYREYFINHLYEIVNKFISDKNMFSEDDFSIYYYDEFTTSTNCTDDIFSNIYFEIDQPLNYKPEKLSSHRFRLIKNKNKFNIPELYFNLTQIKNELYNIMINYFDSNNIIWQDKNSICVKSTIITESNQTDTVYYRLIPCFTHFNQKSVRGIFYYYNNEIDIEYPKLAIENYNKKNNETNDLYRQTVLIFKNIILKDEKINSLPFEIFETILYNVPSEMFVDDSETTILNILNFIRNNPIKNFKTIDEQDYAFSSMYRSMSLYYVKHIIKLIEKYVAN